MCGHELARCHPNPDLTGAIDHVIISAHVSGRIPHNAGSGLNDAFLLFLQWGALLTPMSEHVDHRWRYGLEELYRRLFGPAQVAARGDGAWSLGGSPNCDQIRLGHPGGRQYEYPDSRDAEETA